MEAMILWGLAIGGVVILLGLIGTHTPRGVRAESRPPHMRMPTDEGGGRTPAPSNPSSAEGAPVAVPWSERYTQKDSFEHADRYWAWVAKDRERRQREASNEWWVAPLVFLVFVLGVFGGAGYVWYLVTR
jgi:hypothetical protein